MSEAAAQILAHMADLSEEDRAESALAFHRSLEPEEEGVEAAWDKELSRRVARIRSGEAVGKSADQVFAASLRKRS